MKYLSVCSGIEAATVAWHHIGWKPVGFSEIEKFPSQVLAHHYPDVTNYGDMTKFKEWQLNDTIGLLVGGTPCQSFSVAGLRKGLNDPRGNLMLTFLGIADHFKPKWIVWENVPGVLSSNGGKDFGTFLGALGELGYGFAYRVLDAQFFGVAQRRRRVFVVGCLGDWRRAAAVLFDSESLSGNPAPSREKREEVANSVIPSVAGSLDTECGGGKLTHQSVSNGHIVGTWWDGNQTAATLTKEGAGGNQRMPDKGNFGAVLQPIAYGFTQCDAARDIGVEVSPTLRSGGNGGYPNHSIALAENTIGRQPQNGGNGIAHPLSPALTATNNPSRSPQSSEVTQQIAAVHAASMAVRRLTPTECERLQGFPDGYTDIQPNGKQTPDGPRYKALGNSMAVPVMRWIGERINFVDAI